MKGKMSTFILVVFLAALFFIYGLVVEKTKNTTPTPIPSCDVIQDEVLLFPEGIPRVIIQKHINTDIRTYHFRFELSDIVINDIFNIHGVIPGEPGSGHSYYEKHEYALSIEKGVAFSWKEIEQLIASHLHAQWDNTMIKEIDP